MLLLLKLTLVTLNSRQIITAISCNFHKCFFSEAGVFDLNDGLCLDVTNGAPALSLASSFFNVTLVIRKLNKL